MMMDSVMEAIALCGANRRYYWVGAASLMELAAKWM